MLKHTGKGKAYPNEEIYLVRAIELAQKPVGGNIMGYARKDGKTFVRYNKKTNEYVVAVVGSEGCINISKLESSYCGSESLGIRRRICVPPSLCVAFVKNCIYHFIKCVVKAFYKALFSHFA